VTRHRLRVAARAAFVVLLVASLVSFVTPADDLADPGVDDKVAHALTFAVLAVVGRAAGWRPLTLVTGLAAYAVLTELLQLVLPIGRSADVLDAAADLAGVAVGLASALLVERTAARRGSLTPAAPPAGRSPGRRRG
jgi:VanZ family protein